jgi:hypothetical protein
MAWDDAGVCFEVKNRDLLSDVLAEHFRHRKFSSFQRQLNYFGFKHVGRGIYKHPAFTKADRVTALQISRKTRRKTGKASSQEVQQPHFKEPLHSVKVEGDAALLDFTCNNQHNIPCLNSVHGDGIRGNGYAVQEERQQKLQLLLRHHLQTQTQNVKHIGNCAGAGLVGDSSGGGEAFMQHDAFTGGVTQDSQPVFVCTPLFLAPNPSVQELQYQVVDRHSPSSA